MKWTKIGLYTVGSLALGYAIYTALNQDKWLSRAESLPTEWQLRLQSYYPSVDLSNVQVIVTDKLPLSIGINYGAVTLSNYIFVSQAYWDILDYNDRLKVIIHELTHVEQWQRLSLLYPALYVSLIWLPWQSRPLEKSAIAKESLVSSALGLV